MKKLIIAAIITAVTLPLAAQNLIDVYKKGTVRLVPDTEYARNNDWDKVFETYYDTIYNTPMGNRKSLVVIPDGSVVVNPDPRLRRVAVSRRWRILRFRKTTSSVGIHESVT